MNNLDFIARLAKDGLYNPNCEHFGGANLIVTDKGPHNNDFGDTIVCSTPQKHRQWLSSIFETPKPLQHENHP